MEGLRRHLLLGRGDLYQALLERVGPLRRCAIGAASPVRLCAAPLAAAAAATGVGAAEDDGPEYGLAGDMLPGSRSDAFFARCALTSSHRAVAWSRSIGPDEGSSTEVGIQAQALSAIVLRHWNASRVLSSDVVLRRPRGHGSLVALGSAAPVATVALGGAGRAAEESPARGVRGQRRGVLHSELLLLARPLLTAAAATGGAGALWLSEALPVQQGFLVRCSVGLHSPAFGGSGSPVAPQSPYSNTASFSIVIQRQGCLALGAPHPRVPSTGAAQPAVPSSGTSGFSSALVLHFLCKRLHDSEEQRAGRTSLDGSGGAGRPPTSPLRAAPTSSDAPKSRRWRVVVAAYSVPPDSAAPSMLLASGAVMDQALLSCSGGGATTVPVIDATLEHDVLHIAVEYSTTLLVPEAARSSEVGSPPPQHTASPAPSKRLLVSVLDGPAALLALQQQAPLRASTSLATCGRTLVNVPLALEETLSFGGWHGPGRGRAWIGFAADPSGQNPASSPPQPLVSLDAIDVAVHATREDSLLVDGLRLQYAVPWPLHVLLSGGAMALFGDVFSLVLRCRAREVALHESWKTLSASFGRSAQLRRAATAPPGSAPAATTPATASASEDAAQLSGVRGRRNPVAAASQRAAIAAHQVLRPVWLLRARVAFVLGTWLRYLQTDVVEPATAAYHAAVGAARDFPTLMAAHEALVRAIGGGAFLHSHLVMSTLDGLLDGVDELTSLVTEHAEAGTLLDILRPRGSRERFESVARSLVAGTRLLAAVLQSAAPAALAHALLARLDYNGALTAPVLLVGQAAGR